MSIPSPATLRSLIGQPFHISAPAVGSFGARLASVVDGVPMDADHVCYCAGFALDGAPVPQASYTVIAPDGAVWQLLLTPVRPGADGRPVLEAVFHTLASHTSGDRK
ncbi:DUF6916 family protein [Derxia lacustris]|uniref:DUF6916 family protein n=1 Tax=Derxia lacustris TaxID=764842 RepID=UPI000A16ECE2|nr:hypothetical protein [Derxia lacustris]